MTTRKGKRTLAFALVVLGGLTLSGPTVRADALSKAAQELVVQAYRASFFDPSAEPAAGQPPHRLASGRAGNVIGGGDWTPDGLVATAPAVEIASSAINMAMRDVIGVSLTA